MVAFADDVVEYWFSGAALEQKKRHWFGLKETDDEIKEKFQATWEALSAVNDTALAEKWAAGGVRSVLALLIVWGQFSRVLWRGDGRSFVNDLRVGALAMDTIKSGAVGLSKDETHFLRMPLMHSEDMEVHRWNAEQPGGDNERNQGHLAVIVKYGRFPQRNAALGRESTEEEVAYMASPEAQGRPY